MLATMTWGQWLLAALICFVCFLLMVVILLQKGRGGGLAGAFGGAGGSSAFGAKTGDVFTWITVVGAGVFVLLTVVANFAFDQSAVKTAPPPVSVLPLEDANEPGEGPGRPIPIKVGGNIELGTTDPVTGETKTVVVPVDGVPITAPGKPADGAGAPATPPPADGAAKPESKPEGTPEEKKEEKAPATP